MYLQFPHSGTSSKKRPTFAGYRTLQPSDVDQVDAKAQASAKNWTEKKWLQILPALMAPIQRFLETQNTTADESSAGHLLHLRVQAPKTSRPFASRCVFRASSSSPAAPRICQGSVTRPFCLWKFACQSRNLHKNWPAGLYSTTLGRPPFFAITPTFSSGEAFQTSRIEAWEVTGINSSSSADTTD